MTGIESLARIQDRTYVDNIKEMTEYFVSHRGRFACLSPVSLSYS